ncbi:hypothetical protein [Pseudomonas sp. Irchel 3E20]|uniref:hypothetical protein n=1 Tax=Pseudomonas sp. Irchel 3E20 TaxID=2008983 RepID=UPI0015952D87|nr:hypothetical protein [Pseudomonas sp. Irchel 3E20]
MENFESRYDEDECVARIEARASKYLTKASFISRPRRSVLSPPSIPTKDFDAVVLSNSLVGYGDDISLDNMLIIENLIKFAKLEANAEVPDVSDAEGWYLAFLKCMEEAGCLVADAGYNAYDKSSLQLTMDNIVTDIILAGVNAAKAAIPAAGVLGAIADSTLSALKKEPEAITLFNREVVKARGGRLAVMPCNQLKNGAIITSLWSIRATTVSNDSGVLFFDWKSSGRGIFYGNAYITFNPQRYAGIRDKIESVVNGYFSAALSRRFARYKG